MSGLADLDELLATMEPALAEGSFVYASVPAHDLGDHLSRGPVGLFREEEGITLILPAEAADGLAASAPMRMITLTVHSSLEAVGLTAAFATALTADGISANVVAGYHHDHIFVPERDGERALEVLRALSRTAREKRRGVMGGLRFAGVVLAFGMVAAAPSALLAEEAAAPIPACAMSGSKSVFIGGAPALRLSDVVNCPPELYEIVPSVMIEGQPMVKFRTGVGEKGNCTARGDETVSVEGGSASRLGDVTCTQN